MKTKKFMLGRGMSFATIKKKFKTTAEMRAFYKKHNIPINKLDLKNWR